MKKIVSILAALSMAAALFVSCSNGSSTPKSEPEGPVVVTYTQDIAIPVNPTYGKEDQADNWQTMVDCLPNVKLEAGDKVTVALKATCANAVTAIGADLVDNTQAANWWTVVTEGTKPVFEAENATTDVDGSVTFKIVKSGTAKGAVKLQLYSVDNAPASKVTADYDPEKAPNLSAVTLTITIEK